MNDTAEHEKEMNGDSVKNKLDSLFFTRGFVPGRHQSP